MKTYREMLATGKSTRRSGTRPRAGRRWTGTRRHLDEDDGDSDGGGDDGVGDGDHLKLGGGPGGRARGELWPGGIPPGLWGQQGDSVVLCGVVHLLYITALYFCVLWMLEIDDQCIGPSIKGKDHLAG